MQQLNIFDFLTEKIKINKPVRLIELFAGYGSQSLALKYLGVLFEHHRICEWATKSIQAYNDLHIGDYIDYSQQLSNNDVINKLFDYGISMDYNKPMTYDQIKRKGEKWCRQTYNNIIATHNLVNIQTAKAEDLGIKNTIDYTYIVTYSFPCQDLSLAGKRAGMDRNSGTRSGMLWEVERLLKECKELPQILLMENVTQVHSKKNIDDLNAWIKSLEELGYTSFYEDMNAKNYAIPQNRNRTFMVSILNSFNNGNYTFPGGMKLEVRLKDFLEENVDEKYYLSEKMVKYITNNNEKWTGNNNKSFINKTIASTINTGEGSKRCDASNYFSENFSEDFDLKCIGSLKGSGLPWDKMYEQTCKVYSPKGVSPTLDTMSGGNRQPKILVNEATKKGCAEAYEGDDIGVVIRIGNYSPSGHNASSIVDCCGISPTVMENHGTVTAIVENQNMKTKLCKNLIENGVVKENDVIRHNYSSSRMNGKMKDIQQNNISPTLDTRCDCLGVVVKDIDVINSNYQMSDLRIRKLTPLECWKLMGVKEEDFKKVEINQSNSSLYHLAGDSIVTTCLMAIFGKLFNIDYENKIRELVEELKNDNVRMG